MRILFGVILLLSLLLIVSGERVGRWKRRHSHSHGRDFGRRPGVGWGMGGFPGYNRGTMGYPFGGYSPYRGWGK
ncbi:hypothetical protein OSTOST_17017 [Ostertagia ostertagi]